jgi:hypothetical protein
MIDFGWMAKGPKATKHYFGALNVKALCGTEVDAMMMAPACALNWECYRCKTLLFMRDKGTKLKNDKATT